MIVLERLGTLDVSAASGCVAHGGRLHVVADDGLALHVYDLVGRPVARHRLFDGELPDEPKARKKAKPDLEALALLPDGSLLALGSGSSERRDRGAWIHLEHGQTDVRLVELGSLYERLAREFTELNIEGVAVHGSSLVLAQRGNGENRENALIHLDLAVAVEGIAGGRLAAEAITAIHPLALGELDGVPLSITDLAPARDGTLRFAAAAEDTEDPYLDGVCKGSVLGLLADEGRVEAWWPLSHVTKIEGLTELPDGTYRLVADADDPAVMAPLFGARMPR